MRLRDLLNAPSTAADAAAAPMKAALAPLADRLGSSRAERKAALADKVRRSGLFDPAWYSARYPDVVAEGIDPALHYALHGGGEGRWPHPLFHGDFYLAEHRAQCGPGLNALIHFLDQGAAAGLSPNPLFDPAWYAERYLGGAEARGQALAHFLAHDDTDPSSRFDTAWYRSRYSEVAREGGNALAHYYASGRSKGYLRSPADLAGLSRQVALIRDSGLFDPDFYARQCPEVATSELDPLQHYVSGGYRLHNPHPLFDRDWYGAQAPVIHTEGLNPVVHYLEHGAEKGFDPGPWFETRWYRRTYLRTLPDANPLAHFLADGGRRTSPSPRFDAPGYLSRYPEIAAFRLNPLVHYVTTGIGEGRRGRPVTGESVPAATQAALVCLKRTPRRQARTALFVSHSPNGRIKGHVEPYLRAFAANGADVVFVVASEQRKTAVPQTILDLCASVYVRENAGFDFAAWAHVLLEDDDLLDSPILYLANDSLIGPLDEADFEVLLARIDACAENVVGLADNFYYSDHLQSFFLALKKRCLSSYAFHHFLQSIVSWPEKNAVITEYELTFASRMRIAGLGTRSLFSSRNRHTTLVNDPRNNRTIFDWDNLLAQGFPFVKASLIGAHAALGGEAVREALAERGFDMARLDPTYVYEGDAVRADLTRVPVQERAPRVAFIGPTNYANGLGVAARSYARALYRTPWQVNLHPLERPFHVHARVAPDWQARSFSGRPDVALVHLNGESWRALMSERQRAIVAEARLKVGLFVWETSYVPADWLATIDGLDAIWAPTEFCAEIFRGVSDVPVDVVPYVVENEAGEPASAAAKAELRRTFALDPKRKLILYAFDGSSYLARKNPHALIRAFRAARLAESGWQLVLKTKHVFDIPGEGRRLLDLVGRTRDVVVIDRPLLQNELAGLFELCDVYASSHSSEGFGLTIAEAMEMGKVVVATDYGGSRDFLDATCGFPVAAEIVTLEQSYGPYLRGAHWGEVDEDDLARALTAAARAVAGGEGARIGAAAHRRIRERLSIAAVAAAMEASLGRLLRA